jgi:hypothetical protein
VLDADGAVLATRRVPDGLDGVARLHALLEAGYRVLKIEPIATVRFRERYSSSGGKSDSGDARVGADVARTDALAILKIAAEPSAAARLSKSQIAAALRREGRQRNVAKHAAEIQTALRVVQMQASPVVAGAYATVVASVAHLLEALNRQV